MSDPLMRASVEIGADMKALDRALNELPKKVGASVDRAASQAKGAYRLMQFGQLADDLQYFSEQGLRPVINNIMQLNPVLGLMAIGVDQAVKHWGQLKDAFGDDTFIGKAIRKIDEMTASLRGQADETERLAKAQKERDAALKSVGGVGAEGDAERGAAVTKSLQEVGGGNAAIDVLQKKMTDAGLKLDEKNIGQVRGDLARVIDRATKGDKTAVDELARRSSGTSLGESLARNDPTAVAVRKSEAERRRKEAEEAEKADPDAERLAAQNRARGKEAADAFGEGLQLDLLKANALDDVGGRAKVLKDVQGKLEASGTDKGESEAVAREAVNAAVEDLDKAIRARFLGGESGSMDAARADREQEIRDEMDKKNKTEVEDKVEEARKSEMMGVDDYLGRLQSNAFGSDPALEESKKQTEKLDRIAENTKDMGGKPARFAKAR